MKVHTREAIVRKATSDLRGLLLEWMEEHQLKLTHAEELRVISTVFGESLTTMAKYMIRAERHGDEDKPGGEA